MALQHSIWKPHTSWRRIQSYTKLPTCTARLSMYRRPSLPPPLVAPSMIPESKMLEVPHRMKVYPPLPSARRVCKEPLKTFSEQQLAILDPKSSRTRLFNKRNPDGAKVGDILLVRFRSGDPFAGVCMNIRKRGVDTGILLRSQLTRIGTELWVKVYSPTVTGIEVVQKAAKRARRARLYYLRLPKHDRGNLQGILDDYIRRRSLLGGIGLATKGKGSTVGGKNAKTS